MLEKRMRNSYHAQSQKSESFTQRKHCLKKTKKKKKKNQTKKQKNIASAEKKTWEKGLY